MLSINPMKRAKEIAALIAVSSGLLFQTGEPQARDLAVPEADPEQTKTIDVDGISRWLKARFSEAELAELRRGDLRVEARHCSCYDKPNPHFPYSVLLVITPKGDLVARAEARENAVSITPLAVRYGDRYCEVESEGRCYGSFAHACEFTDFRYGPYLAEFFPTCKSGHTAARLTPGGDGNDLHP